LLITWQALAQVDRWNDLTAQINQSCFSGRTIKAPPLAKTAPEIAKKTFDAHNVNYGVSPNYLALAEAALGKYSDAISRPWQFNNRHFQPTM
jgi:hypothetical protein